MVSSSGRGARPYDDPIAIASTSVSCCPGGISPRTTRANPPDGQLRLRDPAIVKPATPSWTDPAYDVNGLVDTIEADGMRCSGVLATHYHPDHVGGSMMGFELKGITALLDRADVPIHVQADEAEYVRKVTGVTDESLVQHQGDIVRSAMSRSETIHTPGHAEASLPRRRPARGRRRAVPGWFACASLPGSDPGQMYKCSRPVSAGLTMM